MEHKILINYCGLEELMVVRGIGDRLARLILDQRDREGNITKETLCHVPYLHVTRDMIDSFDFRPYVKKTVSSNEGYNCHGSYSSFNNYDYYKQPRSWGQSNFGDRHVSPASNRYQWETMQKVPVCGEYDRAFQMYSDDWHNSDDWHKPYWPPTDSQRLESLGIKFDGSGSWDEFLKKFTIFAKQQQWTGAQRKHNLYFCLQGKASEHLAMLQKRSPNMEYFDVVVCFEKRFGNSPERYRREFYHLRQGLYETIQEWADKVYFYGCKALPYWQEHAVQKELAFKFLQGCNDEEASNRALSTRPKTLDEAVKSLLWHKSTSRLADDGSRTQNVRQSSSLGNYPTEERKRDQNADSSKNSGKVGLELNSSLESKVDNCISSMERLVAVIEKLASSTECSTPEKEPTVKHSHISKEKMWAKEGSPKAVKQVGFLEREVTDADCKLKGAKAKGRLSNQVEKCNSKPDSKDAGLKEHEEPAKSMKSYGNELGSTQVTSQSEDIADIFSACLQLFQEEEPDTSDNKGPEGEALTNKLRSGFQPTLTSMVVYQVCKCSEDETLAYNPCTGENIRNGQHILTQPSCNENGPVFAQLNKDRNASVSSVVHISSGNVNEDTCVTHGQVVTLPSSVKVFAEKTQMGTSCQKFMRGGRVPIGIGFERVCLSQGMKVLPQTGQLTESEKGLWNTFTFDPGQLITLVNRKGGKIPKACAVIPTDRPPPPLSCM